MNGLSRRSFLATSAAALGASAVPSLRVFSQSVEGDDEETGGVTLPTVTLGRTERVLPRLGFGGAPIGRLKSADDGVRVVQRAIQLGVRYFDTAPSYGNGRSEQRIGRALAGCGVDRSEFFVATKTLRRDGDGARRELEESLKRLGLDYVDSVQVHEVHDDVDRLFGENTVLTALAKAKDEGLIKHIGITGHRDPRYLIDAISRYEFATALVPINPLDPKHLSFINEFLPLATEHGVAVVAMKVYAGGSLLKGGRFTARELLRYALSRQQVAIAVPGCETASHVEEAYEAVVGLKSLTTEEQAKLEERAGSHRGKKSEWYKDAKEQQH